MGKRVKLGLVAGATAALASLPASPAAAQNDCIYSGAEYVVHDTVDCVEYLLTILIDWPPR